MRGEKKQNTNTQKKPEPSQQQQNKNSPMSWTKECYPQDELKSLGLSSFFVFNKIGRAHV